VNKELEIWQFAARKLNRNESVMLLVVSESTGSSPGRTGFKMAVGEDDLLGSIGGGVMEVALVEFAKSKKVKGKIEAEIVEQIHRKNSPHSSGMICSGKQTIIFYTLDPQDLPTIRKIVRALKTHQSATLEISNLTLQITFNQPDELDFQFERKEKNDFLFREKLGYKNKLFIIGGGHCALALSELMSKMDFHISLFDDRADLNTLAKNQFVHKKTIVESYENIGEFIESGKNVYVVVMTLGYEFDEMVIRKLVDKKFKYFGVLGSRAKMRTLLRNLEKENFDKQKLAQIHTPIGLPISSRTPEEIAVSIAAEIIQVKNKTS
jgi:xanthine dehydrogenase accessory factor